MRMIKLFLENTVMLHLLRYFFWLQVMILALVKKNPKIPEEQIVETYNGYYM